VGDRNKCLESTEDPWHNVFVQRQSVYTRGPRIGKRGNEERARAHSRTPHPLNEDLQVRERKGQVFTGLTRGFPNALGTSRGSVRGVSARRWG